MTPAVHNNPITRREAEVLFEAEWWRGLTPAEVAAFQLRQTRLCMAFCDFQAAVEAALGRPVWTHEFADFKSLLDEMEGRAPVPTLAQIFAKIPAEKLVVLYLERSEG